ncbi:hypothetical protein IJ670_06165 [bacterium]|nr:hypothetical protein [bacterium]
MALSVEKIYQNPALKSTLKFASEHSLLFTTASSFILGTTVRPLAIKLSPKTDKQDKSTITKKSIASSLSGLIFSTIFSVPFAKGLQKIDLNPKKYLTKETISNLQEGAKNLQASKKYQFISQLFKLGLGVVLAYPKAITTNSIISKMSSKKEENTPSFTGSEKIISKAMNSSFVQNVSDKFKNTNFTTGMMCFSDIFSTLAFINMTNKNKSLEKHKKNVLNLNSVLSTALCIVSGLILDNISDKSLLKFQENLKKYNPNSLDISKYTQGAKIAKTSLIFGSIYYFLIPFLSTFLSSKIMKNEQKTK